MLSELIHSQHVMSFAPENEISGQSTVGTNESNIMPSAPENEISGQSTATTGESQFLNYKSAEDKMSIDYPSDWALYEDILEASGVRDIVIFDSPHSANGASANIIVSQDPYAGKMSVADYLRNTIESNQFVMSNFSNAQSNFNLIYSKSPDTGILLSGMPAYDLLFTYSRNGTDYKNMQVGTISNGKAYYVTYEASPSVFEKFLPIARKMIESFHIG